MGSLNLPTSSTNLTKKDGTCAIIFFAQRNASNQQEYSMSCDSTNNCRWRMHHASAKCYGLRPFPSLWPPINNSLVVVVSLPNLWGIYGHCKTTLSMMRWSIYCSHFNHTVPKRPCVSVKNAMQSESIARFQG
jgi:hypothetical protein